MGILTDEFSEIVTVGKRKFKTSAAFDRVLLAQKVFKDDRLTSVDKLNTSLGLLVENRFLVRCLKTGDREELLQVVYDTQIKVPGRPQVRKTSHRVLDFDLDGEYIYASFMQAYGIDLIDAQGKLHWKKFFALFDGLPDDTKIKQVMRIRSADIPKPNKYNQEEIRNLTELKSYYALPVVGGGGQEGVESLFSALERLAM